MKLEPPTSPYGHLSSTISRLFYCILVWRREGEKVNHKNFPSEAPQNPRPSNIIIFKCLILPDKNIFLRIRSRPSKGIKEILNYCT